MATAGATATRATCITSSTTSRRLCRPHGCLSLRFCSKGCAGGESTRGVVTTPNPLRRRAERLLALALEAREKGDVELAEQLTARAMEYLDEVNGTADLPQPPPNAEPVAQPQQQQQRQQTQPDDDGKEE